MQLQQVNVENLLRVFQVVSLRVLAMLCADLYNFIHVLKCSLGPKICRVQCFSTLLSTGGSLRGVAM